jgi:hypothetical protein
MKMGSFFFKSRSKLIEGEKEGREWEEERKIDRELKIQHGNIFRGNSVR